MEQDPLFAQAKELAAKEEKMTAWKLQRIFKIGYGRSAKLMDMITDDKNGVWTEDFPADASDEEILAEVRKHLSKDGEYRATYLQRRFMIGYGRAARLKEILDAERNLW